MWGERRNEEEEEVKGFFRNLVMEDSTVSAIPSCPLLLSDLTCLLVPSVHLLFLLLVPDLVIIRANANVCLVLWS